MTRKNQPIRNLGIIAHVDAGKTTLTERILFHTGATRTIGNVDSGNTTTDHGALEQQMGITIQAAAVSCAWRDHWLHLIDTPGHADFNIEVERSLRVLDGAVVVLDGVAGVEPQTEKVWRQADRFGVPRVLFVNKLDRPGASFERSLVAVRERLGVSPLPIAWPIDTESKSPGLIDLVEGCVRRWTGDEGEPLEPEPLGSLSPALRHRVEQLQAELVEACAEADPDFELAWLEGRATPEVTRAALRRGTIAGTIVPALGGSAFRNCGVQSVLDAVVELLPAPADRGPILGLDGAERERSAEAPLAAYAFKVVHDRFGPLTFVRVYAGELRKGQTAWRSSDEKRFRIGRVVRVFADRLDDTDALGAGEIGALVGARVQTGETLAEPSATLRLESLEVPEPVVRRAIEPCTRRDRDRFADAMGKVLIEDPSLAFETDPDTGQTLLAGVGELQLEVTRDRLKREHGVEVTLGRPKVACRETLGATATHTTKHVKQSGGPGQYAIVQLEVSPLPRGEGFVFEDRTRGGVLAREYVEGVRKGVQAAMHTGVLGGHPVVDVQVAVLDGDQHSNDSSEMAFQIAGGLAFQEACRKARPLLLEPIMSLEILVSEDVLGAVLGDLGRRRGRVVSLTARGGTQVVQAEVPLVELFGYAGELGGLTHGRGEHSMTFAHHATVPDPLVQQLLDAA